MKIIIKMFFYLLVTISIECCSKIVDPQADSKSPVAVLNSSALILRVGNYCTLDGSMSINGGSDTLRYNWEADSGNPTVILLLPEQKQQLVGFIKNGIYKFRLTVNNGIRNSTTVQAEILVLQRNQIIFEDPSLEVQVRYALKIPTNQLTNGNLSALDSLSRKINTGAYISSLKGLETCQNVSYLFLGLEKISDITPLTQLTNLINLSLTQNRLIKDITPLRNLVKLESLDLETNIVEDITALKNLTSLQYIKMMVNPIKDLTPLSNLIGLKELWLDSSQHGDLGFIIKLKNLYLLWMTDCNVKSILPLKDLTNLLKLNFDGNQINDLTSLINLKQLQWIYLDKNQVSDIGPLESLSNLSRLELTNNQISDILPLVNNNGLRNGASVELWANPLNDKSINEYIPNLRARGVTVYW